MLFIKALKVGISYPYVGMKTYLTFFMRSTMITFWFDGHFMFGGAVTERRTVTGRRRNIRRRSVISVLNKTKQNKNEVL